VHIPPGFLTPEVWIPMSAVSAGTVAYALKKTGEEGDERSTPVMGVLAAFIFASQMVNIPVAGGTSGHLLGVALAVAILGTWPSVVIMTSVIILQAFLFQDGGIDALGANIFSMGIFGSLVAGPVIGFGRRFDRKVFYLSVAAAAWLTVFGAGCIGALLLAASGTAPLRIVFPAMAGVHAVIAVFESVVTVIALRFIVSVSPAFLSPESEGPR